MCPSAFMTADHEIFAKEVKSRLEIRLFICFKGAVKFRKIKKLGSRYA